MAANGDTFVRVPRAHWIAMGLIIVAAVVHHCVLFLWYVDDAAITFAFSKNLANGEGLVPFVGAERVEGYSNPAWTFFLVPFAFVGLDLVMAVRFIQIGLVIPTVAITYLAGRELFASVGADSGLTRHAPLFAPAVLAASALFATWTGAGLEIALMDFVMALAIWRSLVELRTGEWPWSALAWLAVALSRPEAIVYAAVAGFWAMVVQLRAGRGPGPTVRWLATFFVPFGLYQAWRYLYFAWELPNTYYAKLERRPSFPLVTWGARSWRYTRDFAYNMGWGFFVPVWTLAAVGGTGWRWTVGMGIGALGAVVIGAGSVDQRLLLPAVVFALFVLVWEGLDRSRVLDEPRARTARMLLATLVLAATLVGASEALQTYAGFEVPRLALPGSAITLPPYVLVTLALGSLGLAYTDRVVPGRALLSSLVLASVFFALIAQWDWMKGYRWYAPAAVPGALLFGLGLHHVAVGLGERIGGAWSGRLASPGGVAAAVAGLVVLLTVPLNVLETMDRVEHPDASPKAVHRRARYVQKVERRLHLEERLRDLEVDMGGHLYWTDFEMVDIAGLVDVPLGHHKFHPRFVDEYIFEEQRPHFVHLHGAWERNSRIKLRPAWRNGAYVEIPGYPTSRTKLHIGNHVRRDLVLPHSWPHGGVLVTLDGGVVVHGVYVPSEPPVGGKAYVEVGVAQRDVPDKDDFRMWLSAVDDAGMVVQRWDVDPGYGWIVPTEWSEGEVFVGKLDLPVPETMVPGTYSLRLTVLGATGLVRRTANGADMVDVGLLTVLSSAAAAEAAEADLQVVFEQAEADACAFAEEAWFHARKHQVAAPEWVERHEASVRRQLAECWARTSEGAELADQVAALLRAREQDHWAPAYRVAARRLAGTLYAKGHEARDEEDWETAYRAFADAVAVDRSWSWARRYAEEARAERLGIGKPAATAAKR